MERCPWIHGCQSAIIHGYDTNDCHYYLLWYNPLCRCLNHRKWVTRSVWLVFEIYLSLAVCVGRSHQCFSFDKVINRFSIKQATKLPHMIATVFRSSSTMTRSKRGNFCMIVNYSRYGLTFSLMLKLQQIFKPANSFFFGFLTNKLLKQWYFYFSNKKEGAFA